MSVLSEAADFIQSSKALNIPLEAVEVGKRALIDYIGVALAGSMQPVSKKIRAFIQESSSPGQAAVYGTSYQASIEHAALANGIAGHALDFDDTSWTTIGHPTVTVAPAVMAIGQHLRLTGQEVLNSYIIGVEIQNKIAALAMPDISTNGWHTTSVFGPLGAAASASLLFDLSCQDTIHALGIAASHSSGIRANFGTMTKAYHAGMAASNGVKAALLARHGISAAQDVIEGVDGFICTFAGKTLKKWTLSLGDPWDVVNPGLVFKEYPCCSGSHPAINAVLELLSKNTIIPEEIKAIDVGVSQLGLLELVSHFPKTVTEARFSMEFALSAALIHQRLGVSEFSESVLENTCVRHLMTKISVSLDPEFAKLGFIGTAPANISIKMKNGRIFTTGSDLARGNPEKPLTDAELSDKFMECATKVLPSEICKKILSVLFSLDTLNDVADLAILLQTLIKFNQKSQTKAP